MTALRALFLLLALTCIVVQATASPDGQAAAEGELICGSTASGGGSSDVDVDPEVRTADGSPHVSVRYRTPVATGYTYIQVSC